jgi:hypothetical protein
MIHRLALPSAALALVAFAAACGGGSSAGGGGSTGTSSQGTGGSTGGSTGTGTGTGGATGAPFTSKGASSYEAQTSLAAGANGTVVAVWIAFFADGTSSIGYGVSRDGGAGWTAPAYLKSPGGRLASNPVVAVDGQGRAYVAWLGFTATGAADEHVYFAKLDASSTTFGAPVVASDDGTAGHDFDKPSITVDANDNALLAWADFTNPVTPALTFARSADGATFTRSTIAGDTTFGNLGYLCTDASAGPTAPIYAVHLAQGALLGLHKSVDQGKTWSTAGAPGDKNVVFQGPSCAVKGGDLWITYGTGMYAATGATNAPADVVGVVHSSNGGASFDAPVVVSDGAAGTLYLFPQIVKDPSGKLEIVYYQGADKMPATLTRATSDTGATWTTSALGSAGTFTLDRTLASWLGDYLGLGASAGSTFVSYTENSAGKAHIGFTKVTSP